MYEKRPKPSELRGRLTGVLSMKVTETGIQEPHSAQVMEAVLRSVNRTWENFTEGFVNPNEFMRTPFDAPFEIVLVPGKGRGIIASRDIKAGEVVLGETPVLVLPFQYAVILIFLALPRKALEAVLLLHNQNPRVKYAADVDIPIHRLMDLMAGVLKSNAFDTHKASCGSLGVLLLTGSLFNHSDSPNLKRDWDNTTERMVFTSARDIKKGDELEVDYMPGFVGAARAERKENYGIP